MDSLVVAALVYGVNDFSGKSTFEFGQSQQKHG